MDFIERLFGFAPYGGSGSLELMLVSITLVVAFVIGLRRVRQSGIIILGVVVGSEGLRDADARSGRVRSTAATSRESLSQVLVGQGYFCGGCWLP